MEVTAPLASAFVRAGAEAGWGFTEDMNGAQQEGFGPMDATIRPDGVRASASECYPKLECRISS